MINVRVVTHLESVLFVMQDMILNRDPVLYLLRILTLLLMLDVELGTGAIINACHVLNGTS